MPHSHASCDALEPHPSQQNLIDAGFSADVSTGTVVLSLVLSALQFLTYLPQALKITRMRSVHGVSALFVVSHLVENVLHFAAVIAATSPRFAVCSAGSPWRCFTNTLPFYQTLCAAAGNAIIFLAFTYFWARDGKAGSREQALLVRGWLRQGDRWLEGAFLATGVVLATVIVAAILILAATAGVCSGSLARVRDVFAFVGTAMKFLAPLPQIVLLCRLRDAGAVSGTTLALSAFGALVVGANFLHQALPFSTVLPYFVASAMYFVQLFMVICFECRKRRQRRWTLRWSQSSAVEQQNVSMQGWEATQ